MIPAATHPSAKAAWRAQRHLLAVSILVPTPKLAMSQWADQFRRLSVEQSAESGEWRTRRVPYLREIMDAVSDPTVEEIVIKKAAQTGFTQGVTLNTIGYFIHQDPGPILVVLPSEQEAEKFSRQKLAPMLRDTPAVGDRVAEAKAKTSDNTILSKSFPGGLLGLVGGTSPKGLRSFTGRIILFEEVDGLPKSAGAEGDPIAITEKRSLTFSNRKKIKISTPTVKGESRIDLAFGLSDQRHYYVACPHCGHKQLFRWGGPKESYGIKWDEGRPETAYYLCEKNSCIIQESSKHQMLAEGEWIAHRPGRPIRGYFINAFYSPFEGARWAVLVDEFLKATTPELLKVWVNTVLGEVWEEPSEKIDSTALASLRVPFPADIPLGAGILTLAIDVQGDRLEVALWAWGVGEEVWCCFHQRIYGDTSNAQSMAYRQAEALRTRVWLHESGAQLRVHATAIDVGDQIAAISDWVRPRQKQGVFAVRGSSTLGRPVITKPGKKLEKYNIQVWQVGGDAAKTVLFRRFKNMLNPDKPEEKLVPGPGYVHFRDTLDDAFMQQYSNEKAIWVTSRHKKVRTFRQVGDRPNEAIDLWVYGYAGLWVLGPSVRDNLEYWVSRAHEQGRAFRAAAAGEPAVAISDPPGTRRRRILSKGVE